MSLAIPSIVKQTRQIDALVIVCDNAILPVNVVQTLRGLLPYLPLHILSNTKGPGAACTWNTGIEYIAESWPEAYVAILDDDDEWDLDHLQVCEDSAKAADWPDIVVSGLRIQINGEEMPRAAPLSFRVEEFLIGNPGWQGSNTFISLRALIEAGLFTEGLESCNDRDLAIRLLSLDTPRFAFTGKLTASWNLDTNRSSLSSWRGEAKRTGLKQFFALHGHRMSKEVACRFFERAEKLFGWSKDEILVGGEDGAHA